MALAFSAGPIRSPIHPLHAILLAFVFPLYLGTLLADLAYWRSYEIQWSNFAQWLNAGGCLVGGFAVLAAIVSLVRGRDGTGHRGHSGIYLILLLAAWIVGVINALIHAKDAFAIMPEALWLSGLAAVLALLASWVGFSGLPVRGVR